MLKVEPKLYQSPTGRSINIIGINAKFINDFPVSVSPVVSFNFFIEFVTDEGERRDAMNATSDDFFQHLLSKGIPEEQVKTILAQTFGALLAGTKEQRFEAISGLVSFYGYELLPIEEQEHGE